MRIQNLAVLLCESGSTSFIFPNVVDAIAPEKKWRWENFQLIWKNTDKDVVTYTHTFKHLVTVKILVTEINTWCKKEIDFFK